MSVRKRGDFGQVEEVFRAVVYYGKVAARLLRLFRVFILEYEQAIRHFQTIAEWKDSREYIKLCDEKIAEIKKNEQKKQEELAAQKRKKEEERLRRLEQERKKAQRKKKLKVLAIVTCVALAIAFIVGMFFLYKFFEKETALGVGAVVGAILGLVIFVFIIPSARIAQVLDAADFQRTPQEALPPR